MIENNNQTPFGNWNVGGASQGQPGSDSGSYSYGNYSSSSSASDRTYSWDLSSYRLYSSYDYDQNSYPSYSGEEPCWYSPLLAGQWEAVRHPGG